MQICMTKPLLEATGIKPVRQAGIDPQFRWSAKLTKIEKKRSLILCNDQTRLTCILYNLKKKEILNLEELIVETIRKSLQKLGISEKLIDTYFELAGEPAAVTTIKGKSYESRLDAVEKEIDARKGFLDPDNTYQSLLSDIVSATAVITRRTDGKQYPYIAMNRLLETLHDENRGSGRKKSKDSQHAYTLFVQSEQYNRELWRKVIVPPDITFRQLHYVMQVLFDYDNDHLFEFIIQDMFGWAKIRPQSMIDENWIDPFDDDEMLSDTKISLNKVVKDRADLHMYYRYNFFADWIHYIRVQRIQVDQPVTEPELQFGFDQQLGDSPGLELSDTEEELDDEGITDDEGFNDTDGDTDGDSGVVFDISDFDIEPYYIPDKLLMDLELERCMEKGVKIGFFSKF